MTRYVQRSKIKLIGLRPKERMWWPLAGQPPIVPQVIEPRNLSYAHWRSRPVRSDFHMSTEHASVFMTVPYALAHTYWTNGGTRYYEQDTITGTPLPNTRLSSVVGKAAGWVNPPSYIVELCETLLIEKAAQAHASLLTTLGESIQLANYISSKSAYLAQITNAALRGNWKRVKQLSRKAYGQEGYNAAAKQHASKASANGWLEWNYAVLPLIGDITTAVDLYNGKLKWYGTEFLVVKTRGQYDETFSGNTLVDDVVATHKFSARAVYAIDSPVLSGLALMGLSNLPGTAWELTKWSFLIDWLIPVGAWCSSMAPLLGLNLHDSFVGARVNETHVQKPRTYRPPGSPTSAAVPVRIPPVILTGSYRRKLQPRAHLVIKNPFSLSHMATTASLIRQLAHIR